MKSRWALILVGMVLLAGVILYESRPPAAGSPGRITVPELTYATMEPPSPDLNRGFLDNINLSLDAPVLIRHPESVRASLKLQSDLPSAGFDKLQPRPDNTTKPALTVADRKLNYELFGSEDFTLKLSLKPAYPAPNTLIPTGVDPGLGVSIKF